MSDKNNINGSKDCRNEITVNEGTFIEIKNYDENDKFSIFEGDYDELVFDLRKPNQQLEHFIYKGDTYLQVFDTEKKEIVSAIKLDEVVLDSFNFKAYQENKGKSISGNATIYVPTEIKSIQLYESDRPYASEQAKIIDELIARGKLKETLKGEKFNLGSSTEFGSVLPSKIEKNIGI